MWIPLGRPGAIARVAGGRDAPCLFGTVKFYPMGKNTLVVADVCGLPESETGIFALHIHEGRNCTDSGSHYDPEENPHPLHAGDLPPLFSCRGRAFLAVLTDRFSVSQILGRTVIVHSGPDDFTSQPSGDPGTKIACGVICQPL